MAVRYAVALMASLATGSAALWGFGLRAGGGRADERFAAWPPLDMWIRWDAGWYRAIAQEGYFASTTGQSSVAFFPLYPLLMNGLGRLGLDVFVAGELLTVACGLLAVLLFFRWSEHLAGSSVARLATGLLLLWPFAFFLYGAVYSDALFLALVVGAFLMLERRALGWAVLLGALATATRPVAPAVVVGLLVRHLELRRQDRQRWRLVDLAPLLSAGGLGAYMVYLTVTQGDPLAFAHTQVGWGQTPGVESWLKLRFLGHVSSPGDLGLPLLHLLLVIGLLLASWRARGELGWGYLLYVGIALCMPTLSSRDFIGLGRYALAAFPAQLAVARWLGGRPRLARSWLVVSGLLLVWMLVRFARGGYVS